MVQLLALLLLTCSGVSAAAVARRPPFLRGRNDARTLQTLRELAEREEVSPLDEDYFDSERDLGLELGSLGLVPDWGDLAALPACQRDCNHAFADAMKVAFRAENDRERFHGVCRWVQGGRTCCPSRREHPWTLANTPASTVHPAGAFSNYKEGVECQDKLDNCPGRDLFDVLTSGLDFMCVQQRRAFDRVVQCLDERGAEVETRRPGGAGYGIRLQTARRRAAAEPGSPTGPRKADFWTCWARTRRVRRASTATSSAPSCRTCASESGDTDLVDK